MKMIEVLGPGCENCRRLEANVREAVMMAGVEAQIIKVTDYAEIAAHGVLSTPGLDRRQSRERGTDPLRRATSPSGRRVISHPGTLPHARSARRSVTDVPDSGPVARRASAGGRCSSCRRIGSVRGWEHTFAADDGHRRQRLGGCVRRGRGAILAARRAGYRDRPLRVSDEARCRVSRAEERSTSDRPDVPAELLDAAADGARLPWSRCSRRSRRASRGGS
jgi:hypothetical protein